MVRRPTMGANATCRTAIVAAWVGTSLPDAVAHGIVCYGVAWPVAMPLKQLSDRTAVLHRKQRCLSDFVVPLCEKRTDAGVGSATAPATTGRDQPGKTRASHTFKIANLEDVPSSANKMALSTSVLIRSGQHGGERNSSAQAAWGSSWAAASGRNCIRPRSITTGPPSIAVWNRASSPSDPHRDDQ